MSTVEEDIELALVDRFKTLPASDPYLANIPLAWQNNTASPAKPYLRFDHLRNTGDSPFAGAESSDLYEGILQVTVVTPKDVGSEMATKIGGLVAAHFPKNLAMDHGSARAWVSSKPSVSSGIEQEASWDVVVSVRYQCFA